MRHRLRFLLVVLPVLLCFGAVAHAQVSIQARIAGIDIGINQPTYPRLVLVPGTPVYYDANANANYFFYDGLYWVYSNDNWYASSWYNGPWDLVNPDDMPLFVLRVPVRYYRQPPTYFASWRPDAAPRWDEHWGDNWHGRQDGWDQWDSKDAPTAAPLPTYQEGYSGRTYPGDIDQQGSIRTRNYRYQPRETVVQRHFTGSRDATPQDKRGSPDKDKPDKDDKDDQDRK